MLSSIGIIMLYRLDRSQGFKQIIWFGAGIAVFFSACFIFRRVRRWDGMIFLYPAASLLLFVITLIFGTNINGAKNWIVTNWFSIQPSECIKLLFVFFIAAFIKKNSDSFGTIEPAPIEKSEQASINKNEHAPIEKNEHAPVVKNEHASTEFAWKTHLLIMGITYMHLGFMAFQKEWGTALLMFLVYFMLIYVFTGNRLFLLVNGGLAFAGGLGGALLVSHIKIRIDTWLDPWADIAGKGYQITQSLFAIGSGGFFGTGLGLGRPDFIPNVDTDFIFSAICEEMGMFGGVAVVLLYFLLAYRGVKIALVTTDRFMKVLSLGITLVFGFQAFIIVGGVIKLIPLTGITLPFISYGGSSLIICFMMLGILQAVSAGPAAGKEASDGDKD
ncbi:MAG: FtsW/RodA/SpoVE family cell cycle protein [Clostridiales bacterium]|nr:FtsW/RodA/SpoVE family cell cycle protein [Clostridiales bacterium]